LGELPTIAILGGTGKEGSGLAMRWAHAGYAVIIGSRTIEKAESSVAELLEAIPGNKNITAAENPHAAQQADIVVLTVPYSAHKPTLESIKEQVQGKIFVDVTVPLKPPRVSVVQLPEGRTAAEEAQALLGDGVRVVSAFQNVSYIQLKKLDHEVTCDVLVTGNDEDARKQVIELVSAAGTRGIDAGPLANAIVAEGLTAMLIHVNKTYGIKHSGIRITEIDA